MNIERCFEQDNRSSSRNWKFHLHLLCGVGLLLGLAAGCQNSDTGYEQPGDTNGDPAVQDEPVGPQGPDQGPQGPNQGAPALDEPPPPPEGSEGPQAGEQLPPPGSDEQGQPLQLGEPGDTGGSPMQEFKQAQKRLQEINAELGAIEKKVRDNEEVAAAREKLETAAIEKMEESQPNVEEDIEDLQSLGKKIQESGDLDAPPEEQSQETQDDIAEFQKKQKELAQLEQKALQDPEIQKLRDNYEEQLMAALKEADPKAEELIEERKKLMEKLQKLQKQVIQQQLQRQQQQQPPQPQQPQQPQQPAPLPPQGGDSGEGQDDGESGLQPIEPQ